MKPNLRKAELIGLTVKVVDSKNSDSNGKQGIIINETKNLIIIKDNKGEVKKLIKEQNTFEFMINDKKIRLEGSSLVRRPEDRINIK